jgi:ribosomal protein L16 Arg81 hydroxylase
LIEKILKDITPEEFLEKHYLKIPYSQPCGAEEFAPLATWGTLERILSRPKLDLEVVQEGNQRKQRGPLSTKDARGLFADGYTLQVRHAERHDSKLGRLAKGFRKDFHAPVGVHLCLTPDSHSGFDWRRDTKEIFILQAQGSMQFSFRRNATEAYRIAGSIVGQQGGGVETAPVVTWSLSPGDWLYLPSGYWFKGTAREDSISMTVAVTAPAAMKIYDFLKHHLLNSLAWRQRLPALGRGEAHAPGEALLRFRRF